MHNQNNRLACLNAIKMHYDGRAGLLADRCDRDLYWSIWSYGVDHLLEVTKKQEKISIFEYVPIR